jgi:spermidine/putrescine transport system permease protein
VIADGLYVRSTRSRRGRRSMSTCAWWREPVAQAAGARRVTVLYLLWSLLPVLVAVLFSFNAGRSRTTGRASRCGGTTATRCARCGTTQPAHGAHAHPVLGVLATAITVPLGVAMALGLDRWRGPDPAGRELAVLMSFVLPEILIAVSLLFVVTVCHAREPRHQRAGDRAGHLPAVLPRGDRPRPAAHHRQDYEEAAIDLGASPRGACAGCCCRCCCPRSSPARSWSSPT